MTMYPAGWPGAELAPRHPRSDPRRWAPGPFHWGDAAVLAVYVLVLLLGAGSFVALWLGLLSDGDTFTLADQFTMNFVSYVIVSAVVAVVGFRPFVRSLGVFAHGTWWKLLLLPATWFACILVNVIVFSVIGQPETSANQAALEDMTGVAPPVLFVIMTVVFAPLVEEFLFRHLLVGKLSRRVNVWICALVSVAAFALLHFMGTGFDFNPTELIPYLTLAVALTVSYVLFKLSFAYAVALHAVNNGIAVAVLYLVAPHVPTMAGLTSTGLLPGLLPPGL